MATRLQIRRGTAAQWAAANPILAQGEPGEETDTAILKVGDGVTAWTALLATANPAQITALVNRVTQVEVGVTLRSQSQGRGLAGAAVRAAIALAFECTAAARVLGITDVRNLASVRLLEQVGMRRIETRSAVFRGEACVEHVYAAARDGH